MSKPQVCEQPRSAETSQNCAIRIVLRGRVQGLGVRPAIARLARQLQLGGFVANCNAGIEIQIEGPAAQVNRFRLRLITALPNGAEVTNIEAADSTPQAQSSFYIESTFASGSLAAVVPADRSVCSACLAEIGDPENRRFEYPFTTCTQCGPRYSLIRAMPYDRETTGMAEFSDCSRCREEYGNLNDRRFHSQTNGCPKCGPQIWLADPTGRNIVARQEAALDAAVVALHAGKILILRGVGGYQLVVDATSAAAVRELRRRKHREGKPLAVMISDVSAAERLAFLSDTERKKLASPFNPIVILPIRPQTVLAAEVTTGFNTVGLMLPTSPLHALLAKQIVLPLIVTSGNLEGEPLTFDVDTAPGELPAVADLWLHHDRPIVRPIDDSVVRIVADRSTTIRLARGLAPLPLELESEVAVVALGGHQKAAIALTNRTQAVLGPHVGDLENQSVRQRYLAHLDSMCNLYDTRPEWLVHDLHPDYFTSRWAAEQSVKRIAVQHHHAHVVAGMLEHSWLDQCVLGVAFDGTGYGTDGTIWGGEFLLATATDFQRAACLRSFALPGGEAAVREPWRVAVSLVRDALGAGRAARLHFPGVLTQQVEQLVEVLQRPRLSPITTSAGRLFDGVAALILGNARSQFEGQPAMLLEAVCDASASGSYSLPLVEGEPFTLDWRLLIAEILSDLQTDLPPAAIAMKFHRSLADGVDAVRRRYPELPVILSGGCFNNRILAELVASRFESSRQLLGLPGKIPVNDGGLAAGQLAIALAKLRQADWQRKGNQPCA